MTASSFTSPLGPDPALVITDAMITVDHELTHMPVKSAMQLIEFCRNRLAATEARLLSDRIEKGASSRDVEDLASHGGGTSKKEAKKRASRAKATNANPDIAKKMETGQLSTEQADVLAEAAEDTDGAAAVAPSPGGSLPYRLFSFRFAPSENALASLRCDVVSPQASNSVSERSERRRRRIHRRDRTKHRSRRR